MRLRDRTPTIDAIVRQVWTDDVLDNAVPGVRILDNAAYGPPWCFYRATGDVFRFAQVDVMPDALAEAQASPGAFMAKLDADIFDAIGAIRSMPLSTSEALEAGERRRLR